MAVLLSFSTLIHAQSTLHLSSLTERSGPNAQFGTSFADGFADYFHLLNQRDGGIGGARIEVDECETGESTVGFNDCYEAASKRNPLAYSSWSATYAQALTIRTNADQIPFLSAGQGVSVAAAGQIFPWTFVYPITPWSQLSAILAYINTVSELSGQKIGFLYPDNAYGNEPLALLGALSKKYTFEIAQYPVRVEDSLDQSLQWFHILKAQPDWIINWGDGAMNAVAIEHAIKIRFPKDRLIGNALSSSFANTIALGKNANGYLAVNFTAIGQDFPAIQQILENVVDAGNSKVTSRNQVGSVAYNQGLLSAVILAEAIDVAQKKAGTVQIKRTDLREGLENIQLNSARLTALGLAGFSAEITGSCQDHEGGGSVYIQQWNGRHWQQRSEYIEPSRALLSTPLEEAAIAFTAENPDWEPQSCP